MLSDNIRKYRKSKHMSQDELAEKLNVTRQSISLWETGQTQPSLDNIVALAKLFDISTDTLLMDNEPETAVADTSALQTSKQTKSAKPVIIASICLALVAAIIIVGALLFKEKPSHSDKDNAKETPVTSIDESVNPSQNLQSNDDNKIENVTSRTDEKETDLSASLPESADEKEPAMDEPAKDEPETVVTPEPVVTPETVVAYKPVVNEPVKTELVKTEPVKTEPVQTVTPPIKEADVAPEPSVPDEPKVSEPEVKETEQPVVQEKDVTTVVPEPVVPEEKETADVPAKEKSIENLFDYLKDFVIENGTINGDYCYMSKPADTYGGYASEDFSLYYWGDTDTIEFCLHSVMDETFSINFYIYVPKTYTGKYKYTSSYYFRDTGEPLYEATGYITAKSFTRNYPLSCDKYTGSAEVQNDFMEMSRLGICDVIACLENFIIVEGLDYSFEDFGFTSFE